MKNYSKDINTFLSLVKIIQRIAKEYGHCELSIKEAIDSFQDNQMVNSLLECLTNSLHMSVTIANRNCIFDINDFQETDILIFTPTLYKNGIRVSGTVIIKKESNPMQNYLHQDEALEAIDKWVRKRGRYHAGIVAIPTAGGKTNVAVQACLIHAINQNKKVLWLAGTHELLGQALESFNQNAYFNFLSTKQSFKYRMVSGIHDKLKHVTYDDDLILASQMTALNGMQYILDKWLVDTDELIVVIDECHHATCKTYRSILDQLQLHVKTLKVLGITATPFRSNERENNILKNIFPDDILYKTDVNTLIIRRILSKPTFITPTHSNANADDVQNALSNRGELPAVLIRNISDKEIQDVNIVNQYLKHQKEFGKTIVFAKSRKHAVLLNKLFTENGVKSSYVITQNESSITSSQNSSLKNKSIIDDFRNDKLDVLINVNILTEGTDIPNVQTIFLARKTSSKILLTQMVGRALRGKYSGGTDVANIVSFIGMQWLKYFPWITPDMIQCKNEEPEDDVPLESRGPSSIKPINTSIVEKIAIELNSVMKDNVQDDWDFSSAIPVGFYSLRYRKPSVNGNKYALKQSQVLVYDEDKRWFKYFFKEIGSMFNFDIDIKSKEIDYATLESIYDMLIASKPAYANKQTILNILEYYYYSKKVPAFTEISQRDKMDISVVAKQIVEQGMNRLQEKTLIDEIWNNKSACLQIMFGKDKLRFLKMLDNELQKLLNPDIFHPKTA